MKAVLPALARPLLEPHLPAGVTASWFASPADANKMIARLEGFADEFSTILSRQLEARGAQ